MSEVLLEQWVIYAHPTDFPDHFVVRVWSIGRQANPVPGGLPFSQISVAPDVWLREDLEGAREVIAANAPGLVCLQPTEGDDPVIVEVWT